MRPALIAGLFACSVLLLGFAVVGSVITLSGSVAGPTRGSFVEWLGQFVRIAMAFQIPVLSIAFWAGFVSVIAAVVSLRLASDLPYKN